MATSRSKYAICKLVDDSILELRTKVAHEPVYNGILVTEDKLLVIDNYACNLQLYSCIHGKLISTSHTMASSPKGVCLISNAEVAVCLYDSTIEILSFKSVHDVKWVKTLHVKTGFIECHSVAKLNSDKLVVSGFKYGMYYWCVVDIKDGRVDSTHEIGQQGYVLTNHSYLAIKDNTIYISCPTDDGVYAYDIFNSHTHKFLYQHQEWTPGSIIVDKRDFIYVCDLHSNSIHQLTDRGQLVTIHTVSSRPREIFYDAQHGVLFTTSKYSNVITVYRLEYFHQPSIPEEILNMDDRSIQLFEEALKDGKETVHSIRIMVVGHMGVGKTTLVKRLLEEKVNISKRRSTEGIDVHVSCCDVSLSTFEWTRRTKDSGQDYQLQRLARVLNEQQSMKDKVVDKEQARIPPQGQRTVKQEFGQDLSSTASYQESPPALAQGESIQSVIIIPQGETTRKSHERAHTTVQAKDTDDLYSYSSEKDCDQDLLFTTSSQGGSLPASVQMKTTQSKTSTMVMLKLLQENAFNIKQDTVKTSLLTMWDFAGQFAFYTTHQTFLTRRAIYLLVSDVSEQLTDLVADECYFDCEGIMKCRVHELIEVWMNSIHSCALLHESNIPPVILVGTHLDKISQKKSLVKRTESDRQTTLLKRGGFTLPRTPTHAATASKEEPRASTFLGGMQNLLKSRKTKEMVDATPDSSISGAHAIATVDQPKAQRKLSFWQRILEKKRMRADAKKRYRHEICERYFRAIRTYLSDKPTRFHLVDEDFAIDNTVVDSRLEDLKRKIVEVASQQPYWAEQIPARSLPLEQELIRLKAAGIKVIPRSLLEDLNQAGAVSISTEELDLFLRYQHDIGTILYFSLDVLRDKIVLDTQWLIDALKSLITADEMFILRKTKQAVTEKWFEFKQKGKLSPELIDALWTKEKTPDFHDNMAHILLLMEHVNIIAKPRSWSEDSSELKEETYFLAPCMLRQKTPEDVIYPESHPQIKSSSVLCCVFTGKFLPSPIFHRLLAACITIWPIAKRNLENLIFCGCCVFQIDHTHRLILHFRDYVIFARVTKMSNKDEIPDQNVCIQVRGFISINLTKIIGCLGSTLQYDWYIQCPQSDGNDLEKMFPVSELQKLNELPCYFHGNGHMVPSSDVLKFWFKDQVKTEPITEDHINHFRLEIALRNICGEALREILLRNVPPGHADIYQAIKANQAYLTSKRLNKEQCKLVFPGPQDVGKVDEFDISLLFTLIRNVSSIPDPSTGWGNPTIDQPRRDPTLEANVERIRFYRNHISGHSVDGKCSQQEFEDYWKQIEFVLSDIEYALGKQGYREKLEKCKNQPLPY